MEPLEPKQDWDKYLALLRAIGFAALLGALLWIAACATSVKKLGEKYTILEGIEAAPPVDENGGDRLLIYIKIKDEIIGKESVKLIMCENEENKKVLINLKKKLLASSEPIFIYARPVSVWNEYIDGIDYVAVAVGVYDPSAEKYVIILTDYGESLWDAIRSVSWGEFIVKVGQAAVKKAI